MLSGKKNRRPNAPGRRVHAGVRRATLTALFGFGLLGAAAFYAQKPSPPTVQSNAGSNQTQSYVVHAQRNEVLVDVRVEDKHGRPVVNLKQQDFRVLEDGVPQKINSFDFENVEQLATASAEGGPPKVIDLAKLPPKADLGPVVENHRMIVIFFDLTSMPVDDLMRAEKAAQKFVSTQMTPADLVAVATYTSDLRVLQDFTNDRAALSKVLKSLELGESSSLAGMASEGEAGTTDANGEEVVTQDVSEAFTPDETEFNIFNTDQKLAALESLARALRDIPGRKSVIHFSSGIERTGVENQAQLRATTDAANRSDVSFYTVDARGLAALPPGGDATSSSPSGTALYTGSAVSSQFSSLYSGRETLASLATDTGGRTFYDLNDFSPAFRDVQKENSSYYLLGYTPSNQKSDGRFRRIKVEVDRPGVKVEARPGYFAPKNFRQYTRQDREFELQQAMELDAPFVDLPLAVEAAYFRQPDGKYYVVLAAKIPGSAVPFQAKSKWHQTAFDFYWRATDPKGNVAGVLHDTLPVKLNSRTYEQVLSGNLLYEGGMVLDPGTYRLKVVARENRSGKMGTFEMPLALPAMGTEGLAVSSVVVSNELGKAAQRPAENFYRGRLAPQSPLQIGSRSLLPSVTRVFRTNQNLYVYLQSYAPKRSSKENSGAAAGSEPPSVALVFFRGGVKISEAGPFAGKRSGRGGKTDYFVEIPLTKFPPGRYWMQVNVLDPARGEVAFSRLPIAVLRPPTR